jgi:hypothetical protein
MLVEEGDDAREFDDLRARADDRLPFIGGTPSKVIASRDEALGDSGLSFPQAS